MKNGDPVELQDRSLEVDVVIPCRNREVLISDAIESALAQTYPVRKIICVDDGSTDGTLEVMEGYKRRHPDVVQIVSGSFGGACAARNAGLAEVVAEWIQFLDSDDVLVPTKIERQVALVQQAANALDVVAGTAEKDRPGGRTVLHRPKPELPVFMQLYYADIGITSANLWSATAVRGVGGWNVDRPSHQEYDLMFRMHLRSSPIRVAYDLDPSVRMRFQPGSVSAMREDLAWSWVDLRRQMLSAALRDDDVPVHWHREMVDKLFRRTIRLAGFNPRRAQQEFDRIREECGWSGLSVRYRLHWLAYRACGIPKAEKVRRALKRLLGHTPDAESVG
jgi:glycosyltransferase involved in cell wall biosynthesis